MPRSRAAAQPRRIIGHLLPPRFLDGEKQKCGKKKDEHGLPPSDPEAFVFPNRDGSFMDPSNYRKRVLHKLATELGLPKLTFQVIRRTVATLAQKKGTVKDVQGVMRHSRVATTTDVYMQELPEGVRATVDSIHRELQGTMKKLAAKGKVRPPAVSAPAAMVN
jgi:integrase